MINMFYIVFFLSFLAHGAMLNGIRFIDYYFVLFFYFARWSVFAKWIYALQRHKHHQHALLFNIGA